MNILIWLMCLVAYLVGLSGILGMMLGFNQQIGTMPLMLHVVEAVILLVVGGILVNVMHQHYRQLLPKQFLLCDWQWRPALCGVGYGVLMLIVAQVYDQIRQISGLSPSNPQNQQILNDILKMAPLQLVVYAVMIAPVAEELIFRGILGEIVRKWFKFDVLVIVITSLVFALPHALPNSLDFVVYAAMGGVLGVCYWHTGQLKYAMLAHFVNNGITVALMWYASQAA